MAFVLSITGCAGTVGVDFAISADVRGQDQTGRSWPLAKSSMELIPPPPGLESPFPAVKFKGDRFEWTFATSTLGMGGALVNTGADPICFRFDEARIRSSQQTNDAPLSVSSWRTLDGGKWSQLGTTRSDEKHYFPPPPLCVPPGTGTHFSFVPDLASLFPSRRMFNVSIDDQATALANRGIGNWIAVKVPIEAGGVRQLMEVKLTATDAKARRSYY